MEVSCRSHNSACGGGGGGGGGGEVIVHVEKVPKLKQNLKSATSNGLLHLSVLCGWCKNEAKT